MNLNLTHTLIIIKTEKEGYNFESANQHSVGQLFRTIILIKVKNINNPQ